MLARKARIPGDSLRSLNAQTFGRSPFFVAKKSPNNLKWSRFAIIVGTNVDRHAYRRHTLRRRAGHILQTIDFGSNDLVVIILPQANSLPRSKFTEELIKILKI